ncbi:MAG: hypothetical protein JSW40_04250, partial [Candidatus Omnitrophota bacterium]
NNTLFNEEPKFKIRYVFIKNDNPQKQEIIEATPSIKTLEEFEKQFSLEIKETPFVGTNDPIEGIGWQPIINAVAFSLKNSQLSPPLEIKDGLIIIEKQKERPAVIPPLEKITKVVEEKVKEEQAKERTKQMCYQLLETISKKSKPNLKRAARRNRFEYKETDYFKYADYIEGVGLDEAVSKVIFSLQKNQVYPEPLLLLKGAYIIQLKDLTPFDEETFEKEKEVYSDNLFQERYFIERVKFLSQIEKESKLKVYSTLQ